MVKKRFFIGFNGIFLVLFLDICLLISIRTVDHHGRFESITDKWQTLLYVSGVYVSLLLFEMILFLIMRHRKISRLLDKSYKDLFFRSYFFDKGDSIIKSSSIKLAAKNKRVAVFFWLQISSKRLLKNSYF